MLKRRASAQPKLARGTISAGFWSKRRGTGRGRAAARFVVVRGPRHASHGLGRRLRLHNAQKWGVLCDPLDLIRRRRQRQHRRRVAGRSVTADTGMGQDSSAVGFVAASGGAPVSLRDAVSASLQQQIEGDPSVKSELPSSEQSSEYVLSRGGTGQPCVLTGAVGRRNGPGRISRR